MAKLSLSVCALSTKVPGPNPRSYGETAFAWWTLQEERNERTFLQLGN